MAVARFDSSPAACQARPRHAVVPSTPVNNPLTQSMDAYAVPCFCPHSARRLLCWLDVPFLPTHSPSYRKLDRLAWMAGLARRGTTPPGPDSLRMMRCCRGPARAAWACAINLLTHIAYPTGRVHPSTHQTRAGSIEQRRYALQLAFSFPSRPIAASRACLDFAMAGRIGDICPYQSSPSILPLVRQVGMVASSRVKPCESQSSTLQATATMHGSWCARRRDDSSQICHCAGIKR